MSKGQSDLCNEEACLVFSKPLYLDQMPKEFSSLDKAHDEVDSVFVLEYELHVHNERVLNSVENVFLKLNVLELFIVYNHVLSYTLHGIDCLGRHMLDQIDLAEGTLTHHTHNHEVLETGPSCRYLRA